MAKYTEDEFIEKIRTQKKGEYEKVVVEFYSYLRDEIFSSIKHYIRKNGGNQKEVLDTFEDAVCLLLEMIRENRYKQGDAKLTTILYSIARNLWVNKIRKNKSDESGFREEQVDEFAKELGIEIPDERTQKIIEEVFNSIPPECQDILIAFYFYKETLIDLMKETKFSTQYPNETAMRNKKYHCWKHFKEEVQKRLEQLKP